MDSSTIGIDSTRPDSKAETLSERVITAVADAEGVEPTELAPLYDTVDPDALDSLFDSPIRRSAESAPAGEIRFVYYDYEVHETADGEVSLADIGGPCGRTGDGD